MARRPTKPCTPRLWASTKGHVSESWEAMFNPAQHLLPHPENTNFPALFRAYRAFHLTPLKVTVHHFLSVRSIGRPPIRRSCYTHPRNHGSVSGLRHVLKVFDMRAGWWFQPLWKIWKSIGMISPNISQSMGTSKKSPKPPTKGGWAHCPSCLSFQQA